ncbi:hypothetical protein AMTR_s00001p00238540 [Amborella trichopoda]|uniref:Uncharacterized protein n=1 Tax=Amborella trichopoda TaxID=13333 RepID=W1NM99_AMBTC|nr:hypothetical protein AMTR_s00001p00238540 [Amborella trichopoda]
MSIAASFGSNVWSWCCNPAHTQTTPVHLAYVPALALGASNTRSTLVHPSVSPSLRPWAQGRRERDLGATCLHVIVKATQTPHNLVHQNLSFKHHSIPNRVPCVLTIEEEPGEKPHIPRQVKQPPHIPAKSDSSTKMAVKPPTVGSHALPELIAFILIVSKRAARLKSRAQSQFWEREYQNLTAKQRNGVLIPIRRREIVTYED